jgi:HD-GYP domain-containing protein (c-di-GMP phosphodiesterase class II)
MSPGGDSVQDLARRASKLTSVLDVAKAMAAARNLDLLLPLIIHEAAKVVDADRCTLFILDRDRGELWSKIAQGAAKEIRVKLGRGIAGTVAETGEAINITDAYQDPRFNRDVDLTTGYHTRTVLCVPMRDANGDVTGVLQALNKREGTFGEEDTELLLALGGQAAGAIENALLHEEISRLFEGFVAASVVAIESRDPTTAGHSGRVASLTVGLAQALEHVDRGPYAQVRFSTQDVQEIRYASLLHDFGKVGVREPVLVKAEKLYPHELAVLEARFEVARKDLALKSYQRRLASVGLLGDKALPEVEAEEERRLARELAELDEMRDFVLACNKPTVMARDGFERLAEVARLNFHDGFGRERPLLIPRELECLSIPRGSLSAEERTEIESHVTHTFRFLSQIPWTRALRRVPSIAYAHHERLNGKGYPRSISAEDIPVQSKMMAIADVYDALTASDRPYKKAVPTVQALSILEQESKAGALDGELFRVFVQAEVPRKALGPGRSV